MAASTRSQRQTILLGRLRVLIGFGAEAHHERASNLGEKMKYISSVGFDLTPYLKADSKGEGVLNVTLGTHTFLKVKVETVTKNEGEVE